MGDRDLKQSVWETAARFDDEVDAVNGMAVLSSEREYVYVNGAYAGLHGYEDGELVGETWRKVYADDEADRLAEEIQRLEDNEEWRGTATGLRSDGTVFGQELSVSRLEDGGYVFVVCGTKEQEHGETRKELERYKAFVEGTSDIVAQIDDDGTVLYTSHAIEEVLGYGHDEIVGDHAFDYIHPDDRELVLSRFVSAFEDPETRNEKSEFRIRAADGSYVWIEDSGGTPIEAQAEGLVLNLRDISERKEREKELGRYEAFIENSMDILVHLDEDGTVIYQTPSVERILGHPQEERIGENAFDYVHPDDRQRAFEIFTSVVGDGDRETAEAEIRVQHDDGSYVWLEGRGRDQRDTGVGGFVVNLRDITERKEREKELERYEAFVESSLDVIVHVDEEGTVRYTSPSIEDMLGYGQDEAVGDNAFDYVHPDDRGEMMSLFESVVLGLDTGEDNTEFRVRTADGSYVWVEDAGGNQTHPEIDGDVLSLRDVSERKKRQRELERYEALVENTSDLVTLIDEEGTILYQSPSVERILGYDPEDAVGNFVFERVHPEDEEVVLDYFDHILDEEGASIHDAEYRFRRADGTYVWLESSVADRRGTELDGFVVVSREITSRKKQQKKIRRLKNRLDLAVEGASLGVWDWDAKTDEIMYNQQCAEMFGIPPDEASSESEFWRERVHPDDIDDINCVFEEHAAGETEVFDIEYRIRTGDGGWKWINSIGQVVEKDDGEPERVVGVHIDVDERKRTERELEEERDMFAEGPAVVFKWGTYEEGWRVEYVSENVKNLLGYTKQELESERTPFAELVHDDDLELLRKYEESFAEGEINHASLEPYRVRTKDGEVRWVSETVNAVRDDGGPEHYRGYLVDVTERKEREKELERYEALVENTSDVVTLLDVDGTILYQSPSAETIMGYGQHERIGKNGFSYVHPDDRQRAIDAFMNVVQDPETESTVEDLRFQRADGSYLWLEVRATDQRDTDLDGFVINAREITERKKREQEVRRNRELLRHTERISDTGGWEVDTETEELRWTQGTRDVHEVPESYEPTVEEAISFYHGDDRDTIRRALERCEQGEPYDEELRITTAEGRQKWVRAMGEPVYRNGDGVEDDEGDEVVKLRGAIQDISERKEREQELRERKDQIDFFNSLLRHDMLNSMTVIGGSADMLLEQMSEDDERREHVERIDKHSTGIVDMTERVRSVLGRLTEESSAETSPVDVSTVIDESVETLNETYDVSCTTDVPDGVHVEADSFLEHVVDNILINAVEHNDKEEPQVEVSVEEDDDTVTVRFEDNGPGIPDEEKESVFDQGSTGRTSGGVGFGLYYVDAMITEYGGDVYVEDGETGGAVIVVELPKTERTESQTETDKNRRKDAGVGGG